MLRGINYLNTKDNKKGVGSFVVIMVIALFIVIIITLITTSQSQRVRDSYSPCLDSGGECVDRSECFVCKSLTDGCIPTECSEGKVCCPIDEINKEGEESPQE